VNNAFFVAFEPYCRDYRLLSAVFEKIGDLRAFVDIVASLPNHYSSSKLLLEKYL